MKQLSQLIPNHTDLLALEPEELGGALLEVFHSVVNQPNPYLNSYNFCNSPEIIGGYPATHGEDIRRALVEAWVWLESEGFIAPKPEDSTGMWFFITRRGQTLQNRTEVAAYRHANLLPKSLLHPTIAAKVYGLFLRGDYDTAVFQGFKEVEVAVRKGCNYGHDELGVGLMRKAFHPETGPLTIFSAISSEKQAISDLFAGVIGAYKNPQSHRHVEMEPAEAVELLLMASHLLSLVDFRTHHCKH
jgi:uncharacterized protein (TIGR02391 family)